MIRHNDMAYEGRPGARLTVVKLYLDSQILEITGLLSDVFEAPHLLEMLKFQLKCHSIRRLVIDATQAAADPTGVHRFIQFAHAGLKDITLLFIHSQLAEILTFDDAYLHEDSQFLEFGQQVNAASGKEPSIEMNIFSIPEFVLENIGLVGASMPFETSVSPSRRMVEVRSNSAYSDELSSRLQVAGDCRYMAY
jgi:hypothetical protein